MMRGSLRLWCVDLECPWLIAGMYGLVHQLARRDPLHLAKCRAINSCNRKRCLPVNDGVYVSPSPGAVFPSSICSTTKRVPIPNDTSSESSRRDGSNTDLVGTVHYSNCGDIEHGKSAQGGVLYTVVYGTIAMIHIELQQVCQSTSGTQHDELYGCMCELYLRKKLLLSTTILYLVRTLRKAKHQFVVSVQAVCIYTEGAVCNTRYRESEGTPTTYSSSS